MTEGSEMFNGCGKRIAVVGTTGSGKTTLAKQLAQRLQLSHVELDALYWQPNWVPTPTERFQNQVIEALEGNQWIVDGNYSKVREFIWSKADTVVFLDYSFLVILKRLSSRTWQRALSREDLWNGNRESIRQSFFSQKSILIWMIKTYKRRRKEYSQLLQSQKYAHVSVIHLQSPKVAEAWLLTFEINK